MGYILQNGQELSDVEEVLLSSVMIGVIVSLFLLAFIMFFLNCKKLYQKWVFQRRKRMINTEVTVPKHSSDVLLESDGRPGE